MQKKDEIRKIVKERAVLSKVEKNAKIVEKIFTLPEYKKAKSIAFYKSLNNEPSLDALIKDALFKGVQVFLPITNEKIEMSEISLSTIFVKRKFGVLEPFPPMQVNSEPEIVFVPMVAFDKKLNRLGHGMGYYDRYLKDKNCLKIGICFSDYEFNSIPHDKFDIKMDMIISDN